MMEDFFFFSLPIVWPSGFFFVFVRSQTVNKAGSWKDLAIEVVCSEKCLLSLHRIEPVPRWLTSFQTRGNHDEKASPSARRADQKGWLMVDCSMCCGQYPGPEPDDCFANRKQMVEPKLQTSAVMNS